MDSPRTVVVCKTPYKAPCEQQSAGMTNPVRSASHVCDMAEVRTDIGLEAVGIGHGRQCGGEGRPPLLTG